MRVGLQTSENDDQEMSTQGSTDRHHRRMVAWRRYLQWGAITPGRMRSARGQESGAEGYGARRCQLGLSTRSGVAISATISPLSESRMNNPSDG